MLFNSLEFLFFFCAFIVIYYRLYGSIYQRYFFLIASLSFYAFWYPPYIIILIFSIAIDFWLGKKIGESTTAPMRKSFLILSLLLNIGLLGYFKYANLLRESLNQILLSFGISLNVTSHPLNIILPLGISFYTFQSLSYIIDVYKKRIPACKKFTDYALYVTYFPHLIAGPLIRFQQFEQFRIKPWAKANQAEITEGCVYILLGFFKKVLISDNIAWWVNKLFSNINADTHPILILLGALFFAIQIYCDFSGYSDIAIGLGRFCGIRMPDNFNNPYHAKNISDFWQRWHITLSQWLKDYLYIPIGGNRLGHLKTSINIMITMTLGGLWHGASWHFVLWGTIQGIGLITHKYYENSPIKKACSRLKIYSLLSWALTMAFVLLSWLIFRANSTHDLGLMIKSFSHLNHTSIVDALRGSQIKKLLPYITLFIIHELSIAKHSKENLAKACLTMPVTLIYAILFIYGFIFMALLPGVKEPFIYFQF